MSDRSLCLPKTNGQEISTMHKQRYELYALVHDLSAEMGITLDFSKSPDLSGHNDLVRAIREKRYYETLRPTVRRIVELMTVLGEDWLDNPYPAIPAPPE